MLMGVRLGSYYWHDWHAKKVNIKTLPQGTADVWEEQNKFSSFLQARSNWSIDSGIDETCPGAGFCQLYLGFIDFLQNTEVTCQSSPISVCFIPAVQVVRKDIDVFLFEQQTGVGLCVFRYFNRGVFVCYNSLQWEVRDVKMEHS